MDNKRVRYGESFRLTVKQSDPLAETASIFVGTANNQYLISKTSTFTDGIADLTLSPTQTMLPIGEYKYQVNVEYSDGNIDKFPKPRKGCTQVDFVSLPDFIIYEALDEEEVIS